MGTPPSSAHAPRTLARWRPAIISFAVFMLMGGLVGAFLGKPFMFFFFTFWFISIPVVMTTMGILLWAMLIRSIRFFCFVSLVDIGLFFAGIVLGMVATGQ